MHLEPVWLSFNSFAQICNTAQQAIVDFDTSIINRLKTNKMPGKSKSLASVATSV